LEFLRHPQLIPDLFNGHVVRSSTGFYSRFNLSMDRSPGFGSATHDYFALLRLGFPTAPRLPALNLAMHRNSPDRSTKSTLSSLNALQLLVNTGFQVLFHSPPGVLFTFPSRYFSTIGHQLVFCLGGWSPLLPAGFLVLGGTPACGPVFNVFAYGTITLSGLRFPSPHSADVCSSLPQPLPR
jgi:hypothetical protein